jgi:hypothetical protein
VSEGCAIRRLLRVVERCPGVMEGVCEVVEGWRGKRIDQDLP